MAAWEALLWVLVWVIGGGAALVVAFFLVCAIVVGVKVNQHKKWWNNQ